MDKSVQNVPQGLVKVHGFEVKACGTGGASEPAKKQVAFSRRAWERDKTRRIEKMAKLKEIVHIAHLRGSPLGELWAATSQRGLVALDIQVEREEFEASLRQQGTIQSGQGAELAAEALRQVVEYLQGKRRSLDFPIDWECLKPFQRQVLQETTAIPYGQTATYAQIAAQVGKPGAARAVGRAQATNPMPLVIPCHRVLGSDGKLHGYGAGEGLKTKAWLLKMEAGEAFPRTG
jgi:methylated-DNA-[protein]-cysteine S-methyltransferase